MEGSEPLEIALERIHGRVNHPVRDYHYVILDFLNPL
jgi:hypothetical protein